MDRTWATSRARFGGLDGLRAIAVSLVLIYHFFPHALPGGFLGVDVFFVISGFLITSLLVRERTRYGRISLKAFWQRRARRLLPALGLMLLVCTSIAAMLGGDILVSIGRQLAGAAAFVSNWVYIAAGSDYFTRDNPELFRNTWSLAIEEQFYILLPLLALFLFKFCRRTTSTLVFAVAGAASALLMLFFSLEGFNPTRVYFGSDTHAFGLLLGAAMAVFISGQTYVPVARVRAQLAYLVVALAGFGVLGWLAWTLPEGSAESFQGGFQLATIAALATVWAVTRPGAWAGRALDIAPLRWVGERSYGIYLWHWPLLVLAGAAFPRAAGWQIAVVTLAATLFFAALSYRYVEQPVRHFGLRRSIKLLFRPGAYTPRRKGVAIAIGAVLIATVPGTAYAVSIAPKQSSAQAAIERGAAQLKASETSAGQPRNEAQDASPRPGDDAPGSGESANAAGNSPVAGKPATGKTPAEQDPSKALPAPTRVIGTDITAIGDSVMLASAPELGDAFPGISIDAAVSRGMGVGAGIIEDEAAHGGLRQVLVVGLATNGPVTVDELEAIRESAAGKAIVLVNAHGERDWIPGVNDTVTAFAASYPGVVVADWNNAVAGVPDALAGDAIHPNPSGGVIYAQVIQAALDALDSPQEAVGFSLPRR